MVSERCYDFSHPLQILHWVLYGIFIPLSLCGLIIAARQPQVLVASNIFYVNCTCHGNSDAMTFIEVREYNISCSFWMGDCGDINNKNSGDVGICSIYLGPEDQLVNACPMPGRIGNTLRTANGLWVALFSTIFASLILACVSYICIESSQKDRYTREELAFKEEDARDTKNEVETLWITRNSLISQFVIQTNNRLLIFTRLPRDIRRLLGDYMRGPPIDGYFPISRHHLQRVNPPNKLRPADQPSEDISESSLLLSRRSSRTSINYSTADGSG